MKNNVMARSRTARVERLKLRIGPLLLFYPVNDLSLVQEMRSERHHVFAGIESVGHDDLLLTDRGNLDAAELHFRLPVHDPDAGPATAIKEGTDWHPDRLVAGGLFGDRCDGDGRAERCCGGFTFEHVARLKSSARWVRRLGELAQPGLIHLILPIKSGPGGRS